MSLSAQELAAQARAAIEEIGELRRRVAAGGALVQEG